MFSYCSDNCEVYVVLKLVTYGGGIAYVLVIYMLSWGCCIGSLSIFVRSNKRS